MRRTAAKLGLAAILFATMPATVLAATDEGAAPAGPLLFETFERLCIATDSDPRAAEAAARSLGFADDPTATASSSGKPPLVKVTDQGDRLTFGAREVTDSATVPPTRTANCLVAGPDPDGESAAAVAGWIGLPGDVIEDGAVTRYHFEEKDGARLPIPAAESAEAVASRLSGAGETGVHVVTMGEGMTALHQFRVRLAPTKPAPPKADRP